MSLLLPPKMADKGFIGVALKLAQTMPENVLEFFHSGLVVLSVSAETTNSRVTWASKTQSISHPAKTPLHPV